MKKTLLFTIFTLIAFWGYGQWTIVEEDHFDDFPTGFEKSGFGSGGYGAEGGGESDKCAYVKKPATTDYVSKKIKLSVGCKYRFSYMMKRAKSKTCGVTLKYEIDAGTGGTDASAEIIPPKKAGSAAGDRFTSEEIIGDGNDYYLKAVVTNGNGSKDVRLRIDGFRVEKQPLIQSVSISNPGNCNNNETPNDDSDDYYTADVTVTYSDAPTSGDLYISGAGIVGGNTSSGTFGASSTTITGVQLRANSSDFEITAQFGTDSDCPFVTTIGGVAPCSEPMPINLISFDANAENDKVNIKWETLSEENNDYFAVEWSTDGVDFTELAKVNSLGYSREEAEYSYTHTNPAKGYNYYRLAQYDKDGRSQKFEVVSVLFEQKVDSKIYINPNIVYSNLKIEFSSPVVNGRLHIYDTQGKLMNSFVLASGIDVFNFDVSSLPTGQYVVKYLDNNKMITERFLKK